MITEDYVNYEVAKLLKEKGFDETTVFVWYQHLPISLDCQNLVNKKARDYFYYNETTEHNSLYKNSRQKPEYIHGDIFSCPTHQMVMKWLREIYGLHVSVAPYLNEEGEIIWIWEIINVKTATIMADSLDLYDDFNSCEEAVDAALKYCLTKLI